jgi:hypothetical protein
MNHQSKLLEDVQKTVAEMKTILDLEINPHLLNKHTVIYTLYVKNWDFLANDLRDWKWWWWANNPWWNEPCLVCNELWHKYEDEI